VFGSPAPGPSAKGAAQALIPYIERELAAGTRLYAVVRHVLGLFHAVPRARAFRRMLATEAVRPGAGVDVFVRALDLITETRVESAAA
jgi:tRNA-dihydrouridine synthase A